MTEKIKISELPYKIKKSIPNSIKAFSDEYQIEDLPIDIRNIIKNYLSRDKSVSYNEIYDALCEVSEYGDFVTINNIYSLVVEYLKNYLLISDGAYPFDPSFYSQLKYYIQKKNTSLQYKLVTNEIMNIVDAISEDLDIPIELVNLDISQKASGDGSSVYYATGTIRINDVEKKLSIDIPSENN